MDKQTFLAEFRRNVWLEFSLQKIILLLIVAGLTLAISLSTDPTASDVVKITINTALFIGLFGCISKVADSITAEIGGHTWDFQRMSALPSTSIVFGKIFGASSYIFVTVFVVLTLGFITLTNNINLADGNIYDMFFEKSTLALACIVLGMGVTFIATIQIGRIMIRQKRIGDTLLKGLGILIGSSAYFVISETTKSRYGIDQIDWYGQSYHNTSLYYALLAVAIVWVAIGAIQSLKAELQFKTFPTWWVAFMACVTFILCGFTPDYAESFEQILSYSAVCMFGVTIISAYTMILFEDLSIVRYRKLIAHIRARNDRETLILMPRWIPGAFLALVALFVLAGVLVVNKIDEPYLLFGLLAAFFFVLRDIMIMHILVLRQPDKAYHLTFMIYLIILYGILPYFTIHVLGIDNPSVFYVDIESRTTGFMDALPAIIQAAGVTFLFARLLKRKGEDSLKSNEPIATGWVASKEDR